MMPSDPVIPEGRWRPSPAHIRARDDAVHVWRVPLDVTPPNPSVLSRDERARAERMKFPIDRRRWMASHAWLRSILGTVVEVAPEELEFAVGAHGKPMLACSPTRFNMAHAGDLALIAVGGQIDVGVDVEQVRELDGAEIVLVAKRVLGAHVARELARMPRAEQSASFHRAWVRNEAWAKCDGRGLVDPEDAGAQAAQALVLDLDLGAAYAGALAVERAPRSLHLWRAA